MSETPGQKEDTSVGGSTLQEEEFPMNRAWSVHEVARFLAVPIGTLYEWRRTKYGPPARRVGKHLRYWPADVVGWFHGLDTAA